MTQFSQLNNDVILEIFLQFVAIDWDGPFTLMLVCTKWSNLVVSQPRVWTWIMVDETQVEWRERMEIAAHLSKNLPLQIVLRVPFVSQVSLFHIMGRCSSLFLDSKRVAGHYPPEDFYKWSIHYPPKISRSWAKSIISYAQFNTNSAELKQTSDSIVNLLKGVPTHDIQIRSEDQEYTSFAYSAWHVYERLNQRSCIQDVLTSGETFIITALVFKHSESAPLPRIQVLITELWAIFPLLSNLSYLQLADNYIRVPKNITLPHIQLWSLQTLKIESPMTGSIFFSLQDDVWLGLLSLLDIITAPKLEDLSLHGPLHRIVAAMIKSYGRFHPSQLDISISVFDETVDQEKLDAKTVWDGLRRCTVDIPEQNKARSNTDPEVVDALRLLFNMIPRHCSVQLLGDAILEPLMQSDLLRDVELHIVTQMDNLGNVHKPLHFPRKIRSLSLTREYSTERKDVPWICSIEELSTGRESYLKYPYGHLLPMRVLKCAPYTRLWPEFVPTSNAITSEPFSNLTDIHCDYSSAMWMITNHETQQLRSLTLWMDHNSLGEVLEAVEKTSYRLLSLDTLGIYEIAAWSKLLPFIANFNRSRGKGIYTVKLFVGELPHPALLHHLGLAFRGEADEDTLDSIFGYQNSGLKRRYPSGCFNCGSAGWTCYGVDYCSRWRSVDTITITADMPLTEYEGGWGPDGQAWDDLSNTDESEMDAEHENAGDTSEIQ